jgi:hypothetical protein
VAASGAGTYPLEAGGDGTRGFTLGLGSISSASVDEELCDGGECRRRRADAHSDRSRPAPGREFAVAEWTRVADTIDAAVAAWEQADDAHR